jgi:hypothetical protein
VPAVGDDAEGGQLSAQQMEQAKAWLAACDAGCLDPPRDAHDHDAWDQYWMNQLKVGAMEQGFNDQMASDEKLPGVLVERGARMILCAGNGLSSEALALALLGFDVTALDISRVPCKVFTSMFQDPEHPCRRMPGFSMSDDGSATFGTSGAIDPELCPAMHRSDEHAPRAGGSLSYVTGDLSDPEICPGPFEVVIERRTLQLFPEGERPAALDRLTARLADGGVFVSHQHDGGWRPGDDRTHYAETWLASRDFVVHSGIALSDSDSDAASRLAYLVFSSG